MQLTFDQQVQSTPKEGIKAMVSMFPAKGAQKQILEEDLDVSETSIEDNQNTDEPARKIEKEKSKNPPQNTDGPDGKIEKEKSKNPLQNKGGTDQNIKKERRAGANEESTDQNI
jgi:hypothetical protein